MASHWRQTSATWGKRLILVVLILGGIAYGVLSLAERSEEPIRLGLQDYLSKASGQRAEITDLIYVQLTPTMEYRMKGIYIRDAKDTEKTWMKVEQAYIAVPLWNVFLGIRSYLGFEIGGLEAATGFFLPKKLSLDFAGISDPSPDKKSPQFLAEGTYNNQHLLFTAEMIRKDRKGIAPLYRFDDSFRMTVKLGLIEGEAVFMRGVFDVALEDAKIVRDGDVAVFDVKNIERDPVHAMAEGTINDIPFTAELMPRLLKITPGSTKPEDLKTLSRFFAAIEKDIGINNAPETLKIEIVTPETDTKE